ncbi:histidine kinase [Actinoplanes sp. GCM10030250]|uniref:sensor histidine kinase n=1 Tax=Actinoplanes sp. GCM10030250 TaxID=3273376 RepID=UPI00360EE825
MSAPTVLTAMRSRRFLISWWPWRSVLFVVSTVPLVAAVAVPVGVLVAPWIVLIRRLFTGEAEPVGSLLLFVAGAVLLGGLGPLVARPLPAVERHRLRLVDDRPLEVGRFPTGRSLTGRLPAGRSLMGRLPAGRSLMGRLPAERSLMGRSPWRRLGYAVVLVTAVPIVHVALVVTVMLIVVCALSPVLVEGGPISFGVVTIVTAAQAVPYAIGGLIALTAVPYLIAATAAAHAAVARAVLHTAPTEELRAELVEVSQSRARLADAFEAERRRIERDLHDGAQQKLVGLTLQLGLARVDLPDDSPAAGAVATAHQQAKELMGELRELIHGIRPQLLTDLGLGAALRDLAGHTAVPVTVRADLSRRLPEHVEATAYFVVAELLANVGKHSGATRAAVTADERDGQLIVEVTDDGRGGADPARGTGLTGLADRLAVIDGRMLLASPTGGPTVIRAELPCPAT